MAEVDSKSSRNSSISNGPAAQVSLMRRRASMMDKCDRRIAESCSCRKAVQTSDDLDCSRKPQEGAAGGIHSLQAFKKILKAGRA